MRLPGGSQTFAALNLYSARAYGFGLTSLDEACSYAVEVLDAFQAAGRRAGFETAMATQSLVSMAEQVMRYRYGFEVSRALSLLQTYPVRSHVKRRDAVHEFVDAGRGAR